MLATSGIDDDDPQDPVAKAIPKARHPARDWRLVHCTLTVTCRSTSDVEDVQKVDVKVK